MRNLVVDKQLILCSEELETIRQFLNGMGDGARPTPYMKRYAVIRASGAIEVAFKQIIADRVDEDCKTQVKNFIKKKIRDSSVNPKLGQIQNMLTDFDIRWSKKFDELISLGDKPKYSGALTILVNARNEFAHGGTPDIDISTTIECFKGGYDVLKILDQVVHHEFEEGEGEAQGDAEDEMATELDSQV